MSKLIIMLNGPPRAGKDTATAIIAAALGPVMRAVKVTEPIKDATHRRFGLDCAHDALESVKDTPLDVLGGLTPRQAYIATSRDLKARHGDDIVCRMLVERIRSASQPVIVVPDLGDAQEAAFLLREAGEGQALLLRIHRNGHDFSRDCRSWVELPDTVTQFDLWNVEGETARFGRDVRGLALGFIASRKAKALVARDTPPRAPAP